MSLMRRINRIPPRKFVIGLMAGFLVFFFLVSGGLKDLLRISSEADDKPSTAGERRQYSSTSKQKANRAAYELYMEGYNNPEKGEVAGAMAERFGWEDRKAAALMVLGSQDRKEGKTPRFEPVE